MQRDDPNYMPPPMSDEEAAAIRAKTKETVDNIILYSDENPIDTLATIMLDGLSEDEVFMQTVHRLACRDMDLHPDTILGPTKEEAKENGWEHYLSEEDPRYDMYWSTIAHIWNHVLAQGIASSKFRWTHEFAAEQQARREKERTSE